MTYDDPDDPQLSPATPTPTPTPTTQVNTSQSRRTSIISALSSSSDPVSWVNLALTRPESAAAAGTAHSPSASASAAASAQSPFLPVRTGTKSAASSSLASLTAVHRAGAARPSGLLGQQDDETVSSQPSVLPCADAAISMLLEWASLGFAPAGLDDDRYRGALQVGGWMCGPSGSVDHRPDDRCRQILLCVDIYVNYGRLT